MPRKRKPCYGHWSYNEANAKGIRYRPYLTEREEVILSWLQGRAPVGEAFELKQTQELQPDVYGCDRFLDHANIFVRLIQLEAKGYIETVPHEYGYYRHIRVLRTLEQARLPIKEQIYV